MAPPWVVFENATLYGGECRKGADPDIAGIGVVISFVVASFITTSASILAMILDHAFASRGTFSFRNPLRYLKDHIMHTEWKKDYAWRPFLDPLIISQGDQQLITGYAVLLSAWIKVAQHTLPLHGSHFVLILYICALSSSSHLAALITLRKYFYKHKLIARIRMGLVIGYACFLFFSMIAAIAVPSTRINVEGQGQVTFSQTRTLAFIIPMFFILFGFATALSCILTPPKNTDPPTRLGYKPIHYIFRNSLVAFVFQVSLAIMSVTLVLTQKFSQPNDMRKWCDLNTEAENAWGSGQTLPLAMLMMPILSSYHTYLEGKFVIRERERFHTAVRHLENPITAELRRSEDSSANVLEVDGSRPG